MKTLREKLTIMLYFYFDNKRKLFVCNLAKKKSLVYVYYPPF